MFSFYGIFGLEVEIYFVVKKNSKYTILSTFSREETYAYFLQKEHCFCFQCRLL